MKSEKPVLSNEGPHHLVVDAHTAAAEGEPATVIYPYKLTSPIYFPRAVLSLLKTWCCILPFNYRSIEASNRSGVIWLNAVWEVFKACQFMEAAREQANLWIRGDAMENRNTKLIYSSRLHMIKIMWIHFLKGNWLVFLIKVMDPILWILTSRAVTNRKRLRKCKIQPDFWRRGTCCASKSAFMLLSCYVSILAAGLRWPSNSLCLWNAH